MRDGVKGCYTQGADAARDGFPHCVCAFPVNAERQPHNVRKVHIEDYANLLYYI